MGTKIDHFRKGDKVIAMDSRDHGKSGNSPGKLTIPFDDPAPFNGTVERFLRTPFVKRDRIGDAFKSFEKMRSLAAAPGR